MKKFFNSFYGKISALFLILLLALGAAQIFITMQSSLRFVDEADQKLNLPLAQNMANELTPFLKDSLSKLQIEEKIHYMMVMNPEVEIYLLNNRGEILAFFAEPRKKVKKESVDLDPINKFLSGDQNKLILGDDPRFPGQQKTFSAAPLKIGKDVNGFLYIILAGEQYQTAANMIKESYILQTTIKSLFITLLFTGFIGLILFAFLTKRLRKMTEIVKKFEEGQLDERLPIRPQDEIGSLANTFNQMAETIVTNIEELKRTDTLRRNLVANVSHDFRSPLASIRGYLETIIMKDSQLNPQERKQYLEIILNNTNMLSKLIEELFELSKLDAKQIQINPETFNLAELIQDVVMKFNPQATDSHINLQSTLPAKSPSVSADIALIERAISNLVENALRFTPANGSVKVNITFLDKKIRVTVVDSGKGISDKDLPYIFDRFYRVEKSRSRQGGGTGIGLAITKKILELHGSKILVESELDVGTKFFFELDTIQNS
jgi:signal transduction histidine kinase